MKPVAANIKLVDDSISYTPAHISEHLTTSSGELKHMGQDYSSVWKVILSQECCRHIII